MLSIYILTYNEDRNIRGCIESVTDLSDDVHIVDSYSKDSTLLIAKEYGCSIYSRAFDTFGRQCNWALENILFKHDWIMRLDADERVTHELVRELRATITSAPGDVSGIILKKRLYFMGRWIKHGRMYPMLRLCVYRKGAGYYEDLEEEQFVIKSGRTIICNNDFYESNLNNDLLYFTQKHLKYAENECKEFLGQVGSVDLKPTLFGNKIERTRWFKLCIYNKIPLFIRPFVYFVYRYFFCLGFLDGMPGLIFHVLQGFWYRFYIDARIYELRSKWQATVNDYHDI